MQRGHRAPAHRGGVGRAAVRDEGLQARALERDRAGQGPRHGRHRRRPDEPRRLGEDRDRQGRRGRHRARRGGDGLRRLLPVRGRPAARRSTRASRAIIQPGGSQRDPRSSTRPTRPAWRWSSPPGGTSATERPAFKAFDDCRTVARVGPRRSSPSHERAPSPTSRGARVALDPPRPERPRPAGDRAPAGGRRPSGPAASSSSASPRPRSLTTSACFARQASCAPGPTGGSGCCRCARPT